MKKFLFTIIGILLFYSVVTAQNETDTIVRPTVVPSESLTIVNNSSLSSVSGTDIISGRGNSTVTLWDRSKYVNQPKSVVLPNAMEIFDSGLEVPRPSLDQPINDPWNDLKDGYACVATLNKPYYFQQMKFGEEFTLDITFRNVGSQTWDFNIDLMQYTGDQLEKHPGRNVYDIWKDVDPDHQNINSHIVRPGESIRVTVPMRAPTESYHEDNKYYAAYTLVRNWNVYGWDALHDGHWDRMDGNALFCPVYFYIYVPD